MEGRFFNDEDNQRSAPVCVLGESAKVNLLGYDGAVGKYVKVNDAWLQVIGVLAQQATADTDVEGVEVAEPQQHGHRAAQHRDAAVRGQQQLSEGRDRRHLHQGDARHGFDRDRQRGAAPSWRRRTRTPATSR